MDREGERKRERESQRERESGREREQRTITCCTHILRNGTDTGTGTGARTHDIQIQISSQTHTHMPTLTPTPTPAVTDTRTVCVSRQIAAACLKFVFRVLSVGCNNISDRKEFKSCGRNVWRSKYQRMETADRAGAAALVQKQIEQIEHADDDCERGSMVLV